MGPAKLTVTNFLGESTASKTAWHWAEGITRPSPYQLSSIYSYALYETPNSLHNGTCDLLDGLEIRVDLRDLAYQYTKTDIISAYLPVQYDNNLFGASHLTSVNGCLEE